MYNLELEMPQGKVHSNFVIDHRLNSYISRELAMVLNRMQHVNTREIESKEYMRVIKINGWIYFKDVPDEIPREWC